MKPLAVEWVAKAEGDLRTARREAAAAEVRYPGVDSDAEDAGGALKIALRVRAVVRLSLEPPV